MRLEAILELPCTKQRRFVSLLVKDRFKDLYSGAFGGETMTDKMSDEQIYEEAKKRVREKKGFRTHAIVYVVVNAFLALIWWLTGGRITDAWVPWFVWPLGGWGIGLLFHGLGVYVFSRPHEDRRAIEKEAQRIRKERG